MTLREAVLATLQNDPPLMLLLTGGVHTGTEITRQNTPSAFDANSEIKPCALLKFSTDVPTTPPYTNASRTFLQVFFYQHSNYDVIEQARERVYALLHRKQIGTNVWEVQHTDDVLEADDNALGSALEVSRFVAIRLRG